MNSSESTGGGCCHVCVRVLKYTCSHLGSLEIKYHSQNSKDYIGLTCQGLVVRGQQGWPL